MKTENEIIDHLLFVKSKNTLSTILSNLTEKKLLHYIRYSKTYQYKLNKNLDNYKLYESIDIDMVPIDCPKGVFVNIQEENKERIHVYFNDGSQEQKINEIPLKNEEIKKIKIKVERSLNSYSKLFLNCRCIKKINFINETKRDNIIDMSSMLQGCSSLEEIDLSNLITVNVKDMKKMFSGCTSLKKIKFGKFNTNKVIDMSEMFYNCISLKEINLSCFNTKNVVDIGCMFKDCTKLIKLNLYSFSTYNVKKINDMFSGCSSLERLNLYNFNTDEVLTMNSMFYSCESLEELNINNFRAKKVTDLTDMFKGCDSLICLVCGDKRINDEYKK